MSFVRTHVRPRRARDARVVIEPRGFPDRALGVTRRIEPEQGRWAVYLDITMWDETNRSNPLHTIRRRVRDYATREQAEVAAKWMERAAERELPQPPSA